MNPHLNIVVMGVISKKREALSEAQASITGSHNVEVPGLPEGFGTLKEVTKIKGSLTVITR